MASCATCPPTPRPKPLPAPPPAPLCEGSESCVELVDAACVVYRGSALPNSGVLSGERLREILKKFDDLLGQSGASISVRGTNSVQVLGTGSVTTPYRVQAILAPQKTNLLHSTAQGLLVSFGVKEARDLLTLIKNTAELKSLFCAVCDQPAPTPLCEALLLRLVDFPGPDQSVPGTYLVNLSWTPPLAVDPVVDKLLVDILSRPKYSPLQNWHLVESLNKTYSQRLLTGLPHNTVFEFKLTNHCGTTSTSDSNLVEACYVAPITTSTVTTTPTTATISFAFQGADTDSYEIKLLDAGRNPVLTTLASLPLGAVVTQTVPGLTPDTSYVLQVVSRVDSYRSSVYEIAFTTAKVACPNPTNVTITVS